MTTQSSTQIVSDPVIMCTSKAKALEVQTSPSFSQYQIDAKDLDQLVEASSFDQSQEFQQKSLIAMKKSHSQQFMSEYFELPRARSRRMSYQPDFLQHHQAETMQQEQLASKLIYVLE